LNDDLADLIRSDPGAVWMVGNEPERGPNPGETWSNRTDDMHADMYAEAYHDIYHFIKGIDPTARITNAGLIQITPMRLQYLDLMWAAYEQKYDAPMPVDIWTIHAYVMPELTAAGEPNNIASAALGTDLSLGKRGSGYDKKQCSDPEVYCLAEHDDLSLLEEQIVSMRQWMKAHGQRDKPLVVTEYSTLYHYIVNEDGSCGGLKDEFGNCFTPTRVSEFMHETFDYFKYAQDPSLGMPTDNNNLVQQWIWYDAYAWDIGSSNLLDHDKQALTKMGRTFKNYVLAEQTSVNLVVENVSGNVISIDENDLATVQLSASFRNNGNVSIKKSFDVTFYEDAALSKPIGSTTVTSDIRGCAARAYSAEVNWEGLPKGKHQFWVKLDSANVINETDESDNVGSGQVDFADPIYTLDLKIISDGDGDGGSVSAFPAGLVYPEGTSVSLIAVPYSGWTFQGWTGAIVGNDPQATVTMMDNVSVEAHFVQDHYELMVDVIGDGDITINPEKDYYLYGDRATILANPAPEWRFVEWRGDVDDEDPMIELSFASDVSITAVFEISYNAFLPVSMGGS